MKFIILAAALTAFAVPASAAHYTKKHHHHEHTHGEHSHGQKAQKTIVVSCYRGPWEDVIWDHPNAVFIDSLVDVGYDIVKATAIAERVCRDENLVGDKAGLKAEMQRLYREIKR
jgi:hypothetical protein